MADKAAADKAAADEAAADEAAAGATGTGAEPQIPADIFQGMLHAWSALHGFTCLEAFGHLEWLEPDAREALFVGQVRLAAKAAGLPQPDAA